MKYLIKNGWLDNADVCRILINHRMKTVKKVTKTLLRCVGSMVFMGYMGQF